MSMVAKEHNYKTLEALKTKLLHESVSKNETRLFITGACHYSKTLALTACDGHRLVSLKSRYDANLADKIITKDFTCIDGEYVKAEKLLPNESKLNKLRVVIPEHFKNVKSSRLPTKAYVNQDGSVTFDKLSDDYVAVLNAYYIKLLAGFAYTIGFTENDKLKPIFFDLTDDHNYLADHYCVMPLKD